MWDAFKNWIFDCIAFFAGFLGDWGLAILIITVIFRVLVAPIMHKQIKSSFQMQKLHHHGSATEESYIKAAEPV